MSVAFLGAKWGSVDDRMLPPTASSRQVGDLLRDDFAVNSVSNLPVVIPEMPSYASQGMSAYSAQLSRIAGVADSSPSGTFVKGDRIGPPTAPARLHQHIGLIEGPAGSWRDHTADSGGQR